jgi:hypothetical protein
LATLLAGFQFITDREETISDIFRLENLSVCQIAVFRYGLLMRNRGYNEFEMLEK